MYSKVKTYVKYYIWNHKNRYKECIEIIVKPRNKFDTKLDINIIS